MNDIQHRQIYLRHLTEMKTINFDKDSKENRYLLLTDNIISCLKQDGIQIACMFDDEGDLYCLHAFSAEITGLLYLNINAIDREISLILESGKVLDSAIVSESDFNYIVTYQLFTFKFILEENSNDKVQ